MFKLAFAMRFLVLFALLPGSVYAQEGPDAKRAFKYLEAICKIGPRVAGSPGMIKQRELLVAHFAKFNAKTSFQSFDVKHPLTRRPVRLANLIVTWNPKARHRVLLCCHYDTRPWPDQDPVNPRGKFIGANDGGSGCAVLMELAHHMKDIQKAIGKDHGVDFVFFDGEELVYTRRGGTYFLGSTRFARVYRADIRNRKIDHRYSAGVLLDMVAAKNVKFELEKISMRWAPGVMRSVFKAAADVKAKEFVARPGKIAQDDHVPLNQIGRIPTCDLIDTDFPLWHTTKDVPENCSPEAMASVSRVLIRWLKVYAFKKP